MATDGIVGFYMETTNFGATAAFWVSLGYKKEFETDHSSGQFTHPNGGPYLFIAERPGPELETHPILWVADSTSFDPGARGVREAVHARALGVVEATVLDPDARAVSLQAPLPEGASAPRGH